MSDVYVVPAVGLELAGARLGDRRLTNRLVQTAAACAQRPQCSLPRAVRSKAALNAAYSLFGHEDVNEQGILAPHHEQTRRRCEELREVLIVHDTTEYVYPTEREGLGNLRTVRDHGMLMHGSLAISADGLRRPLGIAAVYFWTRNLHEEGAAAIVKGKESERWLRQCHASERHVGPDVRCIHVMDREGDSYELFAGIIATHSGFVIRNRVDRVARDEDEGPTEHLRTLCERAEVSIEMSVPLARRAAKKSPTRGRSLLPREARTAKLAVKGAAVQVRKPPYVTDAPMWLDLNVVSVRELEPSDEAEPIDWTLLTTEPIDTEAQILAVIEHYRSRWIIEEWFKAIKTGCEVEKLQLETYHSLKNTIAMYLVIAWRMLVLRTLARSEPTLPAQAALSSSEIEVLREVQPDARLPPKPTVAQVFVAIAMMGGYIKHRVPPGWLTLARGFETLIQMERGWSAARQRFQNVGHH